ncbi:MAG: Ni/Co efflux regulator RcnB [Arenicella sp.]|jgi:Ni/Co efflux regulator RcnB
MKKVLVSIALVAFIGSFSNVYAQDGEKKVNKTEKKKCDKKKCCSDKKKAEKTEKK